MKRQNSFDTRPMMAIPTAKPQQQPIAVAGSGATASVWFELFTQRISKKIIALASLAVGVLFGLVVLGWWVWPVEWTGSSYAELLPEDKALLVQISSDLNAYDQNSAAVQQLRQHWPELDELACFVASQPMADEAEKIRMMSLAYKVNDRGCP